jgi:hypothetical protein
LRLFIEMPALKSVIVLLAGESFVPGVSRDGDIAALPIGGRRVHRNRTVHRHDPSEADSRQETSQDERHDRRDLGGDA